MDFYHKHRSEEDQILIKEVCNSILNQRLIQKSKSESFCGLVVDGKNREINTLEDFAALYSFVVNSQFNYPIYYFINNTNNFLKDIPEYLKSYLDIRIVKIKPLLSQEEYSKFCIYELQYLLPIENVINFHQDAFLLRPGYEDWLLDNNIDYIGAHWRHVTKLHHIEGDKIYSFDFPAVSKCNLGLSFRKTSLMRRVSETFGKFNLKQIQSNNCPDDAFFSYFGFGAEIFRPVTLKQCDDFSVDPLTRKIWDNQSYGFGCHFITTTHNFPECNHG